MSKELTPLKAWEKLKNTDVRKPFEMQIYADIIETALKELADIKAGKIRLSVNSGENYVAVPKYQYEQDLKQLKALEIIKEKNVNVRAFKKTLLMKQNDDVKLRAYNSQNHRDEDDLTQEEYDLLKEVLNNENS